MNDVVGMVYSKSAFVDNFYECILISAHSLVRI
jgi:hypothetical protein